ncbi:MAG: uracil-DNA glycosylase [bacterium]
MDKISRKTALKTYLNQEIIFGEDEIVITDRGMRLHAFKQEIENCQKCPLGKTRIKFVFGAGNPNAQLMFVGEGPGYEEDRQGEPFVGAAGKLLDKMINAIQMSRETVYIANIVKCHPMKDPSQPEKRGNDRPPDAAEIAGCISYLEKQMEIIKPKVICALGGSAAKTLLNTTEGITKLRGKEFIYNGILLIPTYHPSALLRTPSLKKEAWEDLKKIRDVCTA